MSQGVEGRVQGTGVRGKKAAGKGRKAKGKAEELLMASRKVSFFFTL